MEDYPRYVMNAFEAYRAAIEKIVGEPVKLYDAHTWSVANALDGKSLWGPNNTPRGIWTVGTLVDPSVPRVADNLAWRPKMVATFELHQLHGCCGIAVSCHAQTGYPYRHKGIGKLLLRLKMNACTMAQYTILQATTISENEFECRLLEKAGFVVVHQFDSVRTRNIIKIWMKDLQHKGKATVPKPIVNEALPQAA